MTEDEIDVAAKAFIDASPGRRVRILAGLSQERINDLMRRAAAFGYAPAMALHPDVEVVEVRPGWQPVPDADVRSGGQGVPDAEPSS
ncbi:hypothetical protein [Bradyrhizobium sp.]|jgi:hypothetical protein|uniref:hypothetical protein n=1 Tax=Bradyrhizobium sp. TaxID=376 RepID=UPI002DDCEE99|nr:hypothetical protein [Bradyrhizobium sp.]HEV2155421.1 hypothetical protein [Bradyrhizobium sp.]